MQQRVAISRFRNISDRPGPETFSFFNPRKQRQSYRAPVKLARQDKPADRSGATIMNKDREPAIKTR